MIGALAAIPIAGPIAAAIAGVGVLLANVFAGAGDVHRSIEAREPGRTAAAAKSPDVPIRTHALRLHAGGRPQQFHALTWNALVSACSLHNWERRTGVHCGSPTGRVSLQNFTRRLEL